MDFGDGRLELRSVMPYFYRGGCGGHNGSAVTAKSSAEEDDKGAQKRGFLRLVMRVNTT